MSDRPFTYPKILLHTIVALSLNISLLGLVASQPASAQMETQAVACLPDEGQLSEATLPTIPTHQASDVGCYELMVNYARVKIQPGVTWAQAVADVQANQASHPGQRVDGYFNGGMIGYELYWNGERVGYEPSWTLQQAIANLQWNLTSYPNTKVDGYLNGFRIGYELYKDNVRVRFEPTWTYAQAIADFQAYQQQTSDSASLTALYNGASLP